MIDRWFLLACLCFMLIACNEQYAAVYKNINANDKWDEAGRITQPDSTEKPRSFIMNNAELYLLIRQERTSWFVLKKAELIDWKEAEILQLLDEHPELGKLVPEGWNNWLSMGYGDECKPGYR